MAGVHHKFPTPRVAVQHPYTYAAANVRTRHAAPVPAYLLARGWWCCCLVVWIFFSWFYTPVFLLFLSSQSFSLYSQKSRWKNETYEEDKNFNFNFTFHWYILQLDNQWRQNSTANLLSQLSLILDTEIPTITKGKFHNIPSGERMSGERTNKARIKNDSHKGRRSLRKRKPPGLPFFCCVFFRADEEEGKKSEYVGIGKGVKVKPPGAELLSRTLTCEAAPLQKFCCARGHTALIDTERCFIRSCIIGTPFSHFSPLSRVNEISKLSRRDRGLEPASGCSSELMQVCTCGCTA